MEKRIGEKFNKIFEYCFTFAQASVKLILFIFLLIGATAAFWQFLILYPEKALTLVEAFKPMIVILLQILKWSLIVLLISAIVDLAVNLIKKIEIEDKKRNNKRREQFIKDLAKEIKKNK